MATLTKAQMVEKIGEIFGYQYTKKQRVEIMETLFEIIKRSLESGEDVLMSGFGKFCVKQKNERKGRDPATGETLMLDKRRVVTFKRSGELRDRVNNGNKKRS